MTEALISGNVVCAFISAKWAMELGFSEGRQILFLFVASCPLYLYTADGCTG